MRLLSSPRSPVTALPFTQQIGRLARGFLLACLVAAAARFLSDHYGAPAMLMALLIGMAFNFLAADPLCAPGLAVTSTTLLRAGVALLGFKLSVAELAELGFRSFAVVLGLMALTIGFGVAVAPLLKRRWRFGLLTGGSVAICGASAALAISALLPKGKQLEQDTLFTVVAVTALSTLAMIFYPVLFSMLGLSDAQSGFLIGATVHDVAQVVGAGYSISETAGNIATIVKLQRVVMLPVVLLIVILVSGEGQAKSLRLPGFVVAFLACFALNSTGLVPERAAALAAQGSQWLLLIAISALGVRTSLSAVFSLGPRHLLLIVAETAFLLLMALVAVRFL
ncbi:putative sulfate exporter family transporter [Paracoccus sp. S1E-3]|uniref:YeiH family protein n=1 Tax=Paracoccus sp. S1E-3 TaxID=2756130 RepID=UPI0015EF5604|nr:putative sulfate exporter family transporter [Paracoccus sp. S1E-3]MBA4491741.1 putative sulfate exporter family transporter [Paracoccus sp. S1E-3]